jgi:hypothetical protein
MVVRVEREPIEGGGEIFDPAARRRIARGAGRVHLRPAEDDGFAVLNKGDEDCVAAIQRQATGRGTHWRRCLSEFSNESGFAMSVGRVDGDPSIAIEHVRATIGGEAERDR